MYIRPWRSNVQQLLLLRYICHLMIVACVGADEDIQHHLPGFPLPPPHTARRKPICSRGGTKNANRLILGLAGKAGWCQAKTPWACMVFGKSGVLAMSCGDITKGQSVILWKYKQSVRQAAKDSASSKPPKTTLGSRTPVQKKSSEHTLYCIYRLQLSEVALDSPSWTFAVLQCILWKYKQSFRQQKILPAQNLPRLH